MFDYICAFFYFIISFFQKIFELSKPGFIPFLSAFLGAYFAYRFNLKQQKENDRIKKEKEDEKLDSENFSKLTYLYVYMNNILSGLISTLNFTKLQIDRYEKFLAAPDTSILDGKLLSATSNPLREMKVNSEDFLFTVNKPIFLTQLSTMSYYCQILFNHIEYFNRNIEINFHKTPIVNNFSLVKSCKDNMILMQTNIYYALLSVDKMIIEILKYNKNNTSKKISEYKEDINIKKAVDEALAFYTKQEISVLMDVLGKK